MAIMLGHVAPLFYLAGPFLFFYTRNTLTNTTKLSKLDYLHFLPFVLSLISIFPYYFVDFDAKLRTARLIIEEPSYLFNINLNWLYPSKINLLITPFVFLCYSLYCLFLLWRYISKRKTQIFINYKEKTIRKWLVSINFIIAVININYSYFTIHFYLNPSLSLQERSILAYIIGFLLFVIPIALLNSPQILYGFHKFKKVNKQKKLFCKSGNDSSEMITALILELVKKEENLLNPDFDVDEISKILNIEKEDVLYYFHVVLNKKFITLRKELRVDLAKKEISSGKLLSHSMEGIWMKSGFKSKTSFFVAFKEVTGMTPLEYSKSLEKQPAKNLIKSNDEKMFSKNNSF
jgi:AraC-like DNA-binding protein